MSGRGIQGGVLGGGYSSLESSGRGRGGGKRSGGRGWGGGGKRHKGRGRGAKRRFHREASPSQKAGAEIKYLCRTQNLEGAYAAYIVAKAKGYERQEPEIFQSLLAVCSGVSQRASRRAPKGQPWLEPKSEPRARKRPKYGDEAGCEASEEPAQEEEAEEEENENVEAEREEEEERNDDFKEEELEELSSTTAARRRAVAFAIYEDMKSLGIHLKEAAATMLIRVCCLDNAIKEACTVLEEIKTTPGIKMRLRTYSPLIRCYGRLGRLEEALALKEEAASIGISLGETEHVAIVACCATVNADMKQARAVLQSMAKDVSILSTKASWEPMQAVLKKKGQADVSVDASGKCAACGRTLLSFDLNESEREQLLAQTESLVLHQELLQLATETNMPIAPDAVRRNKQWQVFKSWLDQRQTEEGPIDFVIDGANVGYYNQNYAGAPDHVDFYHIDSVLQHCLSAYLPRRQAVATSSSATSSKDEAQIPKQNRCLIILHARHLSEDRIPPYAIDIVKRWRRQKQLYSCAIKNNDDWYWLYAAVAAGDNCYLVSNDEMRDHHFDMLRQASFINWKERHLTKFDFGPFQRHGNRPVDLSLPPPFSIRMQSALDDPDVWHVPVYSTEKDTSSPGQQSADLNPDDLPLVTGPRDQTIIVQRPDITQVSWLCLSSHTGH